MCESHSVPGHQQCMRVTVYLAISRERELQSTRLSKEFEGDSCYISNFSKQALVSNSDFHLHFPNDYSYKISVPMFVNNMSSLLKFLLSYFVSFLLDICFLIIGF